MSGKEVPIVEIAEKFDQKPDSVRHNLQRGAIRGRKVGRVWMVNVKSAEAFYNDKK